MAQFRSTADILDLILQNGGEVTSGTSPYETQVLNYLNRVHHTIVSGGTIPLGKDTTVEIDEIWPWARSRAPVILELQPSYESGTVSFTQGSEAGTFSSGPAASLAGYHINVEGRDEWYKIASHTAAATAFELDGYYSEDTGSGLSFRACKLDYEVVPSLIIVDQTNDKFQFQKVAGTTLTATLTHGSYTPSDLATHLGTVATTAASGPTISASYSSTTRKFTITSNLAGPTVFYIVGNGSQSSYSIHRTLGFDDETSSASAASFDSVYPFGGLSRLIEPIKIHRGNGEGSIYGVDPEAFQRNYPLNSTKSGYPTRFMILKETNEGIFTIRFNAYPSEKTRLEVEVIPVPRDLKDNSASAPLLPRKHVDVLEDAGTFYLMLNKSDDRAQVYAQLAQGKLKAMISQNRGMQVRVGRDYGQIVPRQDMNSVRRKRSLFGDPY